MPKLWITIPVENVSVLLPGSMLDGDIDIFFNNVEAVDDAIKQLCEVKKNYLVYTLEGEKTI